MKMSKLYVHTLREAPADSTLLSEQLLLRAGMIRKVDRDHYAYMPLGYKVIQKIQQIIRDAFAEEMLQEIILPNMRSINTSEKDKGQDRYVDEWILQYDDRIYRIPSFYGEVYGCVIKKDLKSYKELPLSFYQIHNQYIKGGQWKHKTIKIIEYLTAEGISFEKDEKELNRSYERLEKVFFKIFKKCGIRSVGVVADDKDKEKQKGRQKFFVSIPAGSEVWIKCSHCGYEATLESAVCMPDIPEGNEKKLMIEEIYTPGITTIEQLRTFLKVAPNKLIKCLLLKVDDWFIAALLRGDRELNTAKLGHVLGVPPKKIAFASSEEVQRITGAEAGFAGPVGLLKITMVADPEVAHMVNAIAGANRTNFHLKNVNYGRDFTADIIADIRQIKEEDGCPKCREKIRIERGIEIGEMIKMGTEYGEISCIKFIDEYGKEKPVAVGSYCLDITAILAIIVEQNNDENGIIWPITVAPYSVMITVVNTKNETQMELASKLYKELQNSKIEVLLDDRDERAGVKFKDADLLGIPIHIVIGKKAAEGKVEYKVRWQEEKDELKYNEALSRVLKMLKKARLK